MIFQKEKKLCLFMPPKNGTNTVNRFLRNVGWRTLKTLGHALPEKALADYPNLSEYKYLSFFRNPIERFESAILFIKQKDKERFNLFIEKNGIQESPEFVSYDQIVDLFSDFQQSFKILVAPQSDWMVMPNTEILDFDNFESELRRISGAFDPVKYPITRENSSSGWGKSVITDKVRAFVREYYAADYAIAKNRLGKEYA